MNALQRLPPRLARYTPGLWNRFASSVLPQRLRGGIHDPEFRSLNLDPASAPLIFDVGANVGQSLMTFKTLAPRARVLCFEPVPFSLGPLLHHAGRYRDTRVIPAACGARSGRNPAGARRRGSGVRADGESRGD
jgi:hypothetical protein